MKFGPTYVDPAGDIKVIEKIKTRWVQQFMVCGVTLEDRYMYSDELDLHLPFMYLLQEANGIVMRMQTGNMLCSPEKEAHIEMSVAYHMDELHRGFKSGEFREELICYK